MASISRCRKSSSAASAASAPRAAFAATAAANIPAQKLLLFMFMVD
jgi:hypothetical protein